MGRQWGQKLVLGVLVHLDRYNNATGWVAYKRQKFTSHSSGESKSRHWQTQGLVRTHFLVHRWYFLTVSSLKEGAGSLQGLLYKGTHPSRWLHPRTSSIPKALTPDTITLGLGFNIRIFGAPTFSP